MMALVLDDKQIDTGNNRPNDYWGKEGVGVITTQGKGEQSNVPNSLDG